MTTSKRLTLSASIRNITGRKVKKLRLEGKLPANLFGKKTKSANLTLMTREFEKLYRRAGSTSLIDLQVEGEAKPRPVLISEVQLDPVSDKLLHVDLHEVDLTQKVTAAIPVKITGEAPAVKDKGAVLVTVLTEIDVEALPSDLPDHIEINVSNLAEFGDSILVKNLKVSSDVRVLTKEDETVVMVQEPKKEEEAPTPVPTPTAEGEATAEGAVPTAAGDKKPAAPAEPAKKPPVAKASEDKKS